MLLISSAVWAADTDFNGRWNIRPINEPRGRAWWLEVNGAGTSKLSGRFVGAPGGDLNEIPEISLENGTLRFVFERSYGGGKGKPSKGIYTARLVDGGLEGEFRVEGRDIAPMKWVGKRAPVIKDKDDGSWKEGAAVPLFNGKDLSGWLPMIPGRDLGWTVKDGLMTNVAGANNLISERKFWNFILRAEVRLGQKSNSGIGLRGRYEIQILDDYGREPDTHTNGSLYSRVKPVVNASKPAGEWQTYDIRLVGRTLTVVLNGKTILDKVEVEGLTAMANDPNEAEPGPITIQGDHGSVEFRKLTVTPLTRK
jgi:hypothetical protein